MLSTHEKLETKEEPPFALCSDLPDHDNVALVIANSVAEDGKFYTADSDHIKIHEDQTFELIQKIELPAFWGYHLTEEKLTWHRLWVVPGQGAILSSLLRPFKTLIFDANFKVKEELNNHAFETSVSAKLNQSQFISQVNSETPGKSGLYLCQFVDGVFSYKMLVNQLYRSITLLPNRDLIATRQSYCYLLNDGRIIEDKKVKESATMITFANENGDKETHFRWIKKPYTLLEKWSQDDEGNFKCKRNLPLEIEETLRDPRLAAVGEHCVALYAQTVAMKPSSILQIWDCEQMVCKKNFGKFDPLGPLSITLQKIVVIPETNTPDLLMIDFETLKLTRQKLDLDSEIRDLVRLPNNDVILKTEKKMFKCQIISKKLLSNAVDLGTGGRLHGNMANEVASFLCSNVSDNPMTVFSRPSIHESKLDKSKKITRRASI